MATAKTFKVKLGRYTVPFIHHSDYDFHSGDDYETYIIDPEYDGFTEIGIYYKKKNKKFKAQFVCFSAKKYGFTKDSDYATVFSTESDMIKGFISWLQSLSRSATAKKSKR